MFKKITFNFSISLLCAVFVSFILLLIPITGKVSAEAEKVITAILGICIWLGIAGIVLFAVRTNNNRKIIEKKLKKNGSKIFDAKQIGCISFFKNKTASVCDITLFASTILFVLLMWLGVNSQLLLFFLLSIIFLSFNMHCHFNGKNYVYIESLEEYYKNKKGEQKNG